MNKIAILVVFALVIIAGVSAEKIRAPKEAAPAPDSTTNADKPSPEGTTEKTNAAATPEDAGMCSKNKAREIADANLATYVSTAFTVGKFLEAGPAYQQGATYLVSYCAASKKSGKDAVVHITFDKECNKLETSYGVPGGEYDCP